MLYEVDTLKAAVRLTFLEKHSLRERIIGSTGAPANYSTDTKPTNDCQVVLALEDFVEVP